MRYVQSAYFSFLVNGVLTSRIVPSLGIGQGDPIQSTINQFCWGHNQEKQKNSLDSKLNSLQEKK